ncbi:MAG TPA: ribosome-associated translation inhibitor RaiA [Opitutaceae bacterium]|nr:ribosome-associated translation inhibitor RaiA [Opitutaceae bacterium]
MLDSALKKRPFVTHSIHDEPMMLFSSFRSYPKNPTKHFPGVAFLTPAKWPEVSSVETMGRDNPKFALPTDPHMLRPSSMIAFHPVEDSPEFRASCFEQDPRSGIQQRSDTIFPSVNKTTKVVMNRDMHSNDLIVSGIHLELTPSLKNFVQEKADRLFRHEERIDRIRIELECDPKQDVGNRFVVKGHISIHGPDMNASVSSDDCHKAVCLLVDKLDRMLRRRARWQKVKRKHTHSVEIQAELPKAS